MSLVLNGNGTIQNLVAGGLPDGSVTADDIASLPAGSVLQVVQTLDSSTTQSNSTTYVDVLNASITPSSASSKILILISGTIYSWDNNSLGNTHETTGMLYRGTTSGTALTNNAVYNAVSDGKSSYTVIYLDSPSTTSSQTYTLGMKVLNTPDFFQFPASGYDSTITLMEIAG